MRWIRCRLVCFLVKLLRTFWTTLLFLGLVVGLGVGGMMVDGSVRMNGDGIGVVFSLLRVLWGSPALWFSCLGVCAGIDLSIYCPTSYSPSSM